jgi:hypothetical protein
MMCVYMCVNMWVNSEWALKKNLGKYFTFNSLSEQILYMLKLVFNSHMWSHIIKSEQFKQFLNYSSSQEIKTLGKVSWILR